MTFHCLPGHTSLLTDSLRLVYDTCNAANTEYIMEALSPRSTNIQAKPKLSKLKEKELANDEEKKAEAAKKALKEKDYAPAPPEWVLQPPIRKGGLAEKFRTGKCLGKGGFAICYEGELRNKGRGAGKTIFALKIVKTYMNLKKMEDKVRQPWAFQVG